MKKKKVSKKYSSNKKPKAKKTNKKTKQRKTNKKVTKKTVKKSSPKKKYKSYYKPKKKNVGSASIVPLNVKNISEQELDKSLVPIVPVVSKRPVKYLNNRDLLAQVILSKKQIHPITGLRRMTNELAKMLQLLTSRYAKKGNFANYCVDSQTQALTNRGWLSYNQLTTNDQILSYDISTKQLKWSSILDIYINEYDGTMHYLTTEGLDALVTPNHKFISVETGIKPVEDIVCNEHIVLMGTPVENEKTNTLTLSEIEFIGWAITEGYYSPKSKQKHSILVSQKEGIKADRIRNCLQTANIHYIEYTNKCDIVGFHCTGLFVSNVHQHIAPNKILTTNFIMSLNQEQRLILIETMVSGDGWFRPSGGMSYIQKNKLHVDAFLMLCTLAGQTTYTKLRGYKTPNSKIHPNGTISDCYTTNIYAEPKTQCKAEWIDFHGGKQTAGGRREQKPNIPTQKYNGVIWCPQTEYGTFVCRRNGYIYVTGNTYNEDMQGYAMLMLVKTWNSFDPAKSSNPFAFFTQCIKNSFIQFLNSEKRQRDIKDEVLVDGGMMPSYSYQLEHTNQDSDSSEQDSETIELPTKPIEDVRPFDPVPGNDDLPEGENVGIVDAA